jgi:hypothetical protein
MTGKCQQAITAIVVLMLCGYSARAQDKNVGDWVVGQRGKVAFAKTVIDSNTEFVRTCSDNSCAWILLADVTCEQGVKSDVFINSGAGFALTSMTCGVTKPPAYEFMDNALINRLLDKAAQISVAIPLADGRIKVYLFSLKGAPEALAQLSGANQIAGPDPVVIARCNQLSTAFAACKSEANSALQKCAAWHGPGFGCPYSAPTCYLPSTIDSRCSP